MKFQGKRTSSWVTILSILTKLTMFSEISAILIIKNTDHLHLPASNPEIVANTHLSLLTITLTLPQQHQIAIMARTASIFKKNCKI